LDTVRNYTRADQSGLEASSAAAGAANHLKRSERDRERGVIMEGTDRTAATNQAKAPEDPATNQVMGLVGKQVGRVAIVINGKTDTTIDVANGKARLMHGNGATRASVLVRSMDHFNRIARGQLNIVVASLRGDVAVRGDLTFAINVLRAIASGLPLEGANTSDAKGG
jgi:SCP-2 sterol transfer family